MAERTATDPLPGMVTGNVRTLLRLEGAALLAAATLAFFWLGNPWWLFLVLFLVPDLSFAGYLAGPGFGAVAYNAAHASLGPLALGVIGVAAASPLATALALIWAAHIGFDRALGYGLKYADGFSLTHLGRIGRW